MKRGSDAELRPCPRNGASLGEEAVLADSGRAGEVTAGVGRVRSLAFLSILCEDLLYLEGANRYSSDTPIEFSAAC